MYRSAKGNSILSYGLCEAQQFTEKNKQIEPLPCTYDCYTSIFFSLLCIKPSFEKQKT